MPSAAIHVENIGKRYRLGETHARSIGELLSVAGDQLFGRRKSMASLPADNPGQGNHKDDFWALKNVSFDVEQGEVVGIIGSNGAGKSTLLKILSQIVAPTTGQIEINGRVASLLEVGTGFHQELTGRENVFLNGAILGMSKSEVRRKFDEIVAFAEIEQFIDTPVKRYSSGMYVRLAFAVAAHLEPEILILDEVLAVGDAQFQRKCLDKIGDVGRGGRTVLFVSHNMLAVRSLCKRAVVLSHGAVAFDGDPEAATSVYMQAADEYERLENVYDPDDEDARANGVRLCSARICNTQSRESIRLTVASSFAIEFEWENTLPDTPLNLSLIFSGNDGFCIFNTCTPVQKCNVGRHLARCNVPGGLLNDGRFRISLMFVIDGSRSLLLVNDILVIDVHDLPRAIGWQGKWVGVVRPTLSWDVSIASLNSENE